MFLRYYKKIIFVSTVILVVLINLFSASKNKPSIEISQQNQPADIAVTLSTTSVPTPFADALNIVETQFPDRICNISDYGAVSGGKINNTQSFAKAISACSEQGGGKVTVSAGTWLTGPIKLTSNINLEIQKDADIIFSDDFKEYLPPVFSRFEGIEYYNYSPLIYASNAENIAITGEGTLNGQGEAWWKFVGTSISKVYAMGENGTPVEQRVFATVADGLRPSFIQFVDCNRILISGISILKGPMWTVHPIYSQNIIVRNVIINTAPGPSTDGIVIDSSKNVLVDNATLATGDDAIVIKSGRDNDGRRVNLPSENIVLQNITVNDSHGAIALGSEMSGDIRNVLAQNFTIKTSQYAFRIKSNQQRGGTAENIWVKNLNINSLSEALVQLDAFYERRATGYTDFPPTFKNIDIDGIDCKNTIGSINVFGLTENTNAINNLTFKNINIQKARSGMHIDNAKGIKFENVSLNSKYGPVLESENSEDLNVSNFTCVNPTLNCFYITGKNTKNVILDQINSAQKTKKIILEKDVNQNEVLLPTN